MKWLHHGEAPSIPKYVYTAQIPRYKISNISAHNGIDKNAQKDYNKCGDSYETPIGFHDITFHASRQMLFNYICNPCVRVQPCTQGRPRGYWRIQTAFTDGSLC